MTEQLLEGLLKAQTDILTTLDVYSKLYDRHNLHLLQIQLDIDNIERMLKKLYVIYYPPTPASCRR